MGETLASSTSLTQDHEGLGLLADFRNVLKLVWEHLGLPCPTDVQLDIAYYLQYGQRRMVIEAFRGIGKSWITAVYVLWRLLINPQLEFLVVSASKERADQFSIFAKRIRDEMPLFASLKARPDQRDSNIAWDVGPHLASHAPSVKSLGITGQLTGSRADEIIGDDVEVPNNSATQTQREQLSERVKEFDAILKPGKDTRVRFLGTPQNFESLYNRLGGRGYTMMVWPAQVPTEAEGLTYGPTLSPFIRSMMSAGVVPGMPTDPERFDSQDLMERFVSYGRAGFQLQFMLNTQLSDADKYPLKQSDLIVMDLDQYRGPLNLSWARTDKLRYNELPNLGFNGDYFYQPMGYGSDDPNQPDTAPYTGSVMSIDPSGKGKDETSIAVVNMLYGHLFLLQSKGYMGGYDEDTLGDIAKQAVQYGVNTIVIEDNFGGGMFAQLLRPILIEEGWGGSIEEINHQAQKEKRIIDTIEPVMNQHKLVVSRRVIDEDHRSARDLEEHVGDRCMNYSLFHQLTHITYDRGSLLQDDRLDALSIGIAYWVDRMAQDGKKQAEGYRQGLKTKALEEFIALAQGRKPRQTGGVKARPIGSQRPRVGARR